MRASFVRAPSPLLIGVVRESTARGCIAAIKNCETDGATAIDLHLSCLEERYQTAEALREILSHTALPVLSLHYNQRKDYSLYETEEEARTALLLESAKAGVSAVDVQGYTFDLPSRDAYRGEESTVFGRLHPREVVTDPAVIRRQQALYEQIRGYGCEVLLSTHTGVYLNTEAVVELALFLEQRGPDIIKIVAPCDTEEQLAESFVSTVALKREVKTRVHFHVSGKAGRLSRLINPLLGGHMIFCSDRYSESSNFEQPDLASAAEAIRAIRRCL